MISYYDRRERKSITCEQLAAPVSFNTNVRTSQFYNAMVQTSSEWYVDFRCHSIAEIRSSCPESCKVCADCPSQITNPTSEPSTNPTSKRSANPTSNPTLSPTSSPTQTLIPEVDSTTVFDFCFEKFDGENNELNENEAEKFVQCLFQSILENPKELGV